MAHVHFIGIGGSGISAIARLLLESGHTVSGSDRAMSPFAEGLQRDGATVFSGHDAKNIAGADWVVRSSAIADDNPEVIAAQAAGIPVYKRADFLGRLMADRVGIAIAGTHGKTTTTAMMAWTLVALGADPAFIAGGVVNNLGVNARAGSGAPFVIEADEYDRMFLGLKPRYAVITNVEHDHPDCYPTAADFHEAFVAFAKLVPDNGALIVCADDAGAMKVVQQARQMGKRVVLYSAADAFAGMGDSGENVIARNIQPNNIGGFNFDATVMGQTTPVALQVPGIHNVRNALSVLSAIALMQLPLDKAAAALGEFTGAGRRFDIKGEVDGVTVIDDYGHHPTEIRTTLAGARARYAFRKLWAIWQPHTYSRTQMLFKEFTEAFADADEVIVTEIYRSREAAQNYSSKLVVDAMKHHGAHFIPELNDVAEYLLKHIRPGDVLITFSAGDADQISVKVLDALKQETHHV